MLRRLVYRGGRDWITMRPGEQGIAEQDAADNQDNYPYIGTPTLFHHSCPALWFSDEYLTKLDPTSCKELPG
jgi:hypothetical protein